MRLRKRLPKTILISVLMMFLLGVSYAYAESVLELESLAHDPHNVRFIYRMNDGKVNIKFQVQREDVDGVNLILSDGQEIPMQYYVMNNFYSYYVLEIQTEQAELRYQFKVAAGDETVIFGPNGTGENAGEFVVAVDSMQTFSSPDWAKGAIIYQIFPDRFFNGDPENDPVTGEYSVHGSQVVKLGWDQLPLNPPRGADFFGGDLQGVIAKLDYLADLGVQAIYLNPIHEAISNHKYDASDYLKVDSHFGSNEIFKQLVDEAKKRGMYIIIDGVFNHTGSEFWAFKDVREKGEASPYADWYSIYSFPPDPALANYKGWNGYSSLPVLNYENPEVREYILDVVRYWLGLGVKGIRLDAPKEVPHDFWLKLNQVAKEIDPEVLIIGEVWDDASAWINTGEFDSTMNYLYRDLMIKTFITRSKRPSKFVRELGMYQTSYTEETNHVLFNLISSHDKERFLTLAKGNTDLMKPLIIFQFSYLGAPAIYYGDEVGLEGGADPDNRRPMIWDEEKQNQELLSLYRQMIQIRRTHQALQRGSFKSLYTDDRARVLVFEREYAGERVLAVLNYGDEPYTLEIPFNEWKIQEVKDLVNDVIYNLEKPILELKNNHGTILLVQ